MVHFRRLARIASSGLLVAALPVVAWGRPLDVADLAPRPVRVEVPGTDFALPASYGPNQVGGVPSTTEGRLVVSGTDYESYLAGPGTSPGGDPVAGSFSDAVLLVDLATGTVDAGPITGQVDIMIGPYADLTRTLGTDRIAGYQSVEIFPGSFVTIFCDGPTVFGPCTIVPGSPYDPSSGELTLVGDDTLDHPDITDPRFGRYFVSDALRLVEAPSQLPGLGAWGASVLAIALMAGAAGALVRGTVRE